jgi:hypothetical protein
MDAHSLDRWAGLTVVGAGLLFILDLFLGWQKVSIAVSGVVDVEGTASGFRGWGLVAAVFAVVLVALVVAGLRAGPSVRRPFALTTSALGLAISGALAAFTGDASVHVQTNGVGVEVESTLWPAWVGLVLAVVAAAAALAPLVSELGSRHVHRAAPHGSA